VVSPLVEGEVFSKAVTPRDTCGASMVSGYCPQGNIYRLVY